MILVYFMDIWPILRPFDILDGHLVYFEVIWYSFYQCGYIVPGKIWQPRSFIATCPPHFRVEMSDDDRLRSTKMMAKTGWSKKCISWCKQNTAGRPKGSFLTSLLAYICM
jgi:hypothetical protein